MQGEQLPTQIPSDPWTATGRFDGNEFGELPGYWNYLAWFHCAGKETYPRAASDGGAAEA